MKVALLLYGQPRFVDRGVVFQNHKDLILDRYDTDVFAQCWHSPYHDYEKMSSWAREHGAYETPCIPDDAPQQIIANYDPIRISVDRPLKCEINDNVFNVLEQRFTGNSYYSHENINNIFSQITALDRVCNLLYHEQNYDFHILARYDAILENMPDLHTLDSGKFYLPHGGHFNDLVHIFGSAFLWPNPFAGLADRVVNDFSLAKRIELPIPELYKYEQFTERYGADKLERIGMYAHVIRK